MFRRCVWRPAILWLLSLKFCQLVRIGLVFSFSFCRFLRGLPDHVDAHGDIVLDGNGEEGGRLNLEVGEGCRNGAREVMRAALDGLVEEHMGVVGSVAGELNFKVAVERGRCERRLRQAEANTDDGELGAAAGLDHVQIAVAVARVEGLDCGGDQEVALPGVADSFAARGVADAVDLVHGMRHVIAEGGLVEEPRLAGLGRTRLGVNGGEGGQREQQDGEHGRMLHGASEART